MWSLSTRMDLSAGMHGKRQLTTTTWALVSIKKSLQKKKSSTSELTMKDALRSE